VRSGAGWSDFIREFLTTDCTDFTDGIGKETGGGRTSLVTVDLLAYTDS